jgi:hypothetical protein
MDQPVPDTKHPGDNAMASRRSTDRDVHVIINGVAAHKRIKVLPPIVRLEMELTALGQESMDATDATSSNTIAELASEASALYNAIMQSNQPLQTASVSFSAFRTTATRSQLCAIVASLRSLVCVQCRDNEANKFLAHLNYIPCTLTCTHSCRPSLVKQRAGRDATRLVQSRPTDPTWCRISGGACR